MINAGCRKREIFSNIAENFPFFIPENPKLLLTDTELFLCNDSTVTVDILTDQIVEK